MGSKRSSSPTRHDRVRARRSRAGSGIARGASQYLRFIHRGEWDRVRLLSSVEHPELCNKTYVEISELWHKDPWDCYFDILADAGPRLDACSNVGRLFTEEHIDEMLKHPLISLAVDGSSTRIDGPLAEQSRTPINYCGMTHYVTHHVRERGTLRLEEAIRKMTSLPATHHGLRGRGLLRPGFKADVQVFYYDRLADVSTLEQPAAYVRGVEHVLVNGTIVVDKGEHTGARPGRVLTRS